MQEDEGAQASRKAPRRDAFDFNEHVQDLVDFSSAENMATHIATLLGESGEAMRGDICSCGWVVEWKIQIESSPNRFWIRPATPMKTS